MILEGTGDDLGSRSAPAIGEKDERNRRCDWIICSDESLVFTIPRADAGDLQSLLEEEIADAQRLIEDSARVATEIDDDAARALTREARDGAQ